MGASPFVKPASLRELTGLLVFYISYSPLLMQLACKLQCFISGTFSAPFFLSSIIIRGAAERPKGFAVSLGFSFGQDVAEYLRF